MTEIQYGLLHDNNLKVEQVGLSCMILFRRHKDNVINYVLYVLKGICLTVLVCLDPVALMCVLGHAGTWRGQRSVREPKQTELN